MKQDEFDFHSARPLPTAGVTDRVARADLCNERGLLGWGVEIGTDRDGSHDSWSLVKFPDVLARLEEGAGATAAGAGDEYAWHSVSRSRTCYHFRVWRDR